MAVTQPSDLAIVKQLTLTGMASDPLKTALTNLNYLWKYHQPPLLDVCPVIPDFARGGTYQCILPIYPAVNSVSLLLNYQLELRVMPLSGCTSLVMLVETGVSNYTTTAWTTLFSATVGCTSGTLVNWQPTADGLTGSFIRISVTPNTGSAAIHQVLLYPKPDPITAGIRFNGFIPFDDAMSSSGSPIHTEYLNRCKDSTVVLLRDRLQCAMSFAQRSNPLTSTHYLSPPAQPKFSSLPPVRCVLPFADEQATLYVCVLAYNSHDPSTTLVKVVQTNMAGGESALFTANGERNIVELNVRPVNPGTIGAYVDLQIWARSTGTPSGPAPSGYETKLDAVVAWWRPL